MTIKPLGIVVSGFPGVGKSHLVSTNTKYKINDSDSSQFDNTKNYVEHIIQKRKEFDIILVSSHEDVRAELDKQNIPYQIVFPGPECKAEYLERYRIRGSTNQFIDLIDKNWDKWIDGCLYDGSHDINELRSINGYRLKSGNFISDVVDRIVEFWKEFDRKMEKYRKKK